MSKAIELHLASKGATTTFMLSFVFSEIFSSSNCSIILSIPQAKPMQPSSFAPNLASRLLYLPPPNNVDCAANLGSVLLISKTKFVY